MRSDFYEACPSWRRCCCWGRALRHRHPTNRGVHVSRQLRRQQCGRRWYAAWSASDATAEADAWDGATWSTAATPEVSTPTCIIGYQNVDCCTPPGETLEHDIAADVHATIHGHALSDTESLGKCKATATASLFGVVNSSWVWGPTASLSQEGEETYPSPSWSPTGSRLVYLRQAGGSPGWAIVVANADGSGVVDITPEGLADFTDPRFSPDGTQVLVSAYSFVAGERGLYSMPAPAAEAAANALATPTAAVPALAAAAVATPLSSTVGALSADWAANLRSPVHNYGDPGQ